MSQVKENDKRNITLSISLGLITKTWGVIYTDNQRGKPVTLFTHKKKETAVKWAETWKENRERDFPKNRVTITEPVEDKKAVGFADIMKRKGLI